MQQSSQAAGAVKSSFQSLLHGAVELPTVFVESYSEDIKDKDGFFGERVSNGAFRELLNELRENLKATGDDPIDRAKETLSKQIIDRILLDADGHCRRGCGDATGRTCGSGISESASRDSICSKRFTTHNIHVKG